MYVRFLIKDRRSITLDKISEIGIRKSAKWFVSSYIFDKKNPEEEATKTKIYSKRQQMQTKWNANYFQWYV